MNNAPIVFGLFGRQIGDEDTIRPSLSSSSGKFLKAHLQHRIEISEQHERDLAALPDAAHQFENTSERCTRFQCAFGGALNRGAIGKRIAERHAEFNNVGARIRQGENKLVRCVKRRIARRDVRDDAKFARCAQFSETLRDTGRLLGRAGH